MKQQFGLDFKKVPANTSEKMKVFAKDFLSKCKQIRSFLRSCSYIY